MLTKNEIIAALPTLKPDELKAIHAVIFSLLGEPAGVPTTPLAVPVFDAVSAVLGRNMRHANMPPALAQQFNKNLTELLKFFGNYFPNWNSNKTRRTAFLFFMLNLLKADIMARGLTPTYKIMIQSLGQMAPAFDREFPGYRRSGLGHLILDKFK